MENLNQEISKLRRELAYAEMAADAEARFADEMKAERDAAKREQQQLRLLLKEAQDALDFFKTWGESLNQVLGYNPTEESWKPTLEAIAKIDEKLAEK